MPEIELTPIRREILKGLDIIHRGVVRGLFTESLMPPLHHAVQLVIAATALMAMEQIPPDDRWPDHAAMANALRENIARLNGEGE